MQRFGQYTPNQFANQNGYNFQSYMQPRMQQSFDNIIRVSGIDGANAYQMPPNSRAALFDGNEDIVYIKTTDGAGFPSMVPYSLTRMDLNQGEQSPVTRKDLDLINSKIDHL